MATKRTTQTKRTKTTENSFVRGWEERVQTRQPQLVKVSWIDACVDGSSTLNPTKGWVEDYGVGGVVMQTTGYLLYNSDEWVVVAQERHAGQNSGFRRIQQIPKYSVCEIKVFEKAQ